jgi:ER lumen protein retaining receptor
MGILSLLFYLLRSKSGAGISGKTQILYGIVFTTRYLDLVTNFISVYNSLFKVIFIGATYFTLYLIYIKYGSTHDKNDSSFRVDFVLIVSALLALVFNHEFTSLEVLWTFSVYLESLAILPQLFLVSKSREAKPIIMYYLFCLSAYRSLYICNWIYRFNYEGFYDLIAIISGIVQGVLCWTALALIYTIRARNDDHYGNNLNQALPGFVMVSSDGPKRAEPHLDSSPYPEKPSLENPSKNIQTV